MNIIDFEIISHYPALNDEQILPFLSDRLKGLQECCAALNAAMITVHAHPQYCGHFHAGLYRKNQDIFALSVELQSQPFANLERFDIVLGQTRLHISTIEAWSEFQLSDHLEIKSMIAGYRATM